MTIPKDAERRRIFLMRHGSVTYFDDEGRPIRPDTVPLNEAGRAQATAAGKLFAAADIRFDRVIVSGLKRTVETAERVLAETGHAPRIEINAALREVEGGKLSDIPDAELRDAFTGALDGSVSEEKRFLGGESIGTLLDRVIPEIDTLRADASWDIVLLVLHGGVNRALISYLLTGERKFFGAVAQSPACINAIDVGERKTDVALRMMNHSPLDPLQAATRKTTMEALYDQYLKFRKRGITNVQ